MGYMLQSQKPAYDLEDTKSKPANMFQGVYYGVCIDRTA